MNHFRNPSHSVIASIQNFTSSTTSSSQYHQTTQELSRVGEASSSALSASVSAGVRANESNPTVTQQQKQQDLQLPARKSNAKHVLPNSQSRPLMLYGVFLVFTLCLLAPVVLVDGTNVLAVLPSVWQSHYIFGRRLLQHLANQQNCTVTIISPYGKEENIKDIPNFMEASTENNIGTVSKIREIHVDKLFDNWIDMGLSFNIEQAHQQSMLEHFTRLIYAGTANVDLLLANVNVRKLLRSKEKFDLVFIDLFLSDALLGLALYYNAPTVVISPNGANTWLNRMIGNPQSSALDPSNFLPYTERMSVWERCANTLMGLFEKLTYNFFHMISQQAVYVKHFQALYQLANNATVPLPHHRDLTQNLSLILLNSHPIIQYPRAFLPNVLPVGGVHLKTKALQIPNHIKNFIESARQGVVYISLGADARTVDLAEEKLDALFDVMSYMKEMNFLLKWEIDNRPKDLSHNVLINSWFPQEEILAHPNVKIFISACGVMSVIESINGLTPLLAIPIYPEQFVTATRLHTHGLAVILPFDNVTYEGLLNNIQELLENASYHSNVKMSRELLNADYGTPAAKTLHYVNLVIRTGGADYLKTHAHHLNFMRSKLFDVIGIISLGLGGILAVPFLLICCILKRSYYNQRVVEAAAAAAPTSNTTLSHSRSKVSLINASATTANSGNISPTAANLKVGLIATTTSVPSSLQDAVATPNSTPTIRKTTTTIHRRLSASALWASNVVSSNTAQKISDSQLTISPNSYPTPSSSSESHLKT